MRRNMQFLMVSALCMLAGLLAEPSVFAQTSSQSTIADQILARLIREGRSPAEARKFLDGINSAAVVDRAVREVVDASDGVAVKKIGSWLKPTGKYKDPARTFGAASDHDMTIFLQESLDQVDVPMSGKPLEAIGARWSAARGAIQTRARIGFEALGLTKDEAARLVNETVNVYPPKQLMVGVETAEDAEALFREFGFPGRTSEGVYGFDAFLQTYERSSGALVYKDAKTGRVMSGATDLAQFNEGLAEYNVLTTSRGASQFASKAKLAVGESSPKDVLKNLDRLDKALSKSKQMARLVPSARTNGYLTELITAANAAPDKAAWLRANGATLQRALSRAEGEAALLMRLAGTTNPAEIDILFRALESNTRWTQLLENVGDMAARTGQTLGATLKGLLAFAVAMELYGVANVAIDRGANAATIDAGLRVIRFTNLPAALAEMALEDARSGGLAMLARSQDCEDMVAGIYSVKGREHEGPGITLPDLARQVATVDGVREAVQKHAAEAARRGFTAPQTEAQRAVEAENETAITTDLVRTCTPAVLRAWQLERNAMLAKVLETRKAIEQLLGGVALRIWSREDWTSDSGLTARVTARPAVPYATLTELLKTLDAGMKELAGPGGTASYRPSGDYTWTLDGRILASGSDSIASLLTKPSSADDVARTINLTAEPPHELRFIYRLRLTPTMLWDVVAVGPDGAMKVRTADMVFDDALTTELTMTAAATVPLTAYVPPPPPSTTTAPTLEPPKPSTSKVPERAPVAPPTPSSTAMPATPAIAPVSTTLSCALPETIIKNGDKTLPSAPLSFTAPGAGQLTVTFTYLPGARSTVRYRGDENGYRSYAQLSWKGEGAAQGRVSAGSLYKAEGNGKVTYLTETSGKAVIPVQLAGPITFAVTSEATPGYYYQGRFIDNWYEATHTRYHPGSCKVQLEFKPR